MKSYRRYPPEVGNCVVIGLVALGMWGLIICTVWWLWL